MRNHIILLGTLLIIAACSSDNDPPPPLNSAPTITPVSDQSIAANNASAPIVVQIVDDQTAIAQLQLTVASDNNQLVPTAAITINSNSLGRELVITPTAAMTGSALITVTAADTDGASSSTTFGLTVVQEELSYAQFLRSVFGDNSNDLPRDINSREFIQDANDDNFADLL